MSLRAIEPARLDAIRGRGEDGHGNPLVSFTAGGDGEPLRCCLRYAESGEQIALISYAPFDHPSVWTEVGPVYVHVAQCDRFVPTGRLPEPLASGPCVLRTYRADDTMYYEHNTVVTDNSDPADHSASAAPLALPTATSIFRRQQGTVAGRFWQLVVALLGPDPLIDLAPLVVEPRIDRRLPAGHLDRWM